MQLLVFEYITGGGFNGQSLPPTLLTEGSAMLSALLADCFRLKDLSVRVLLEERCLALASNLPCDIIKIPPAADVLAIFERSLAWADAVWLIAPESEGILHALCERVEKAEKPLLTSSASAVALTADKWLTYQYLQTHQLPTAPTRLLSEPIDDKVDSWIVKPRDGAGCFDTWHFENYADLQVFIASREQLQLSIMQPFITGVPASLSCLFAHERAEIICVNEQRISSVAGQLQWLASEVNSLPCLPLYQQWADKIAQTLPGLHGYVGIDFISDHASGWILEINPRLTTSYAGIYAALGRNLVAEVVHGIMGIRLATRSYSHQV